MNVQFDVLDDVLNTIRLHGTVYFQKRFTGNWGVATRRTPYKKFQIIVEGECWLQAPFLPSPIRLCSGDIAAFPHGSPYTLSAELDSPCISGEQLLAGSDPAFSMLETAIPTTVIFGHIEFTRDFNHPFMSNLPELIHITARESGQPGMLRAVVELIVAEVVVGRPGSGAILKRLAEVLHLHTLRAHMLSGTGTGSFPAAFDDPSIYRALQLIHKDFTSDWTLEAIAEQVNMSRTSFATRFRQMIGIPPMRYITMWRMQKAREMLETSDQPLSAIALVVGYGSEAAFSHAFQHEFHESPGHYRQRIKEHISDASDNG